MTTSTCCERCEKGWGGESICSQKKCPCHSSPTEGWREEAKSKIVQGILGALEYRGFSDLGKYLDDDVLEHVWPTIEQLLSQHQEAVIVALEKLKYEDPRLKAKELHPEQPWNDCESCVENYNYNVGVNVAIETIKNTL